MITKKPLTPVDLGIAVLLVICGFLFAILPLRFSPPALQSLVVAQGPLISYSLYKKTGRRANRREVLALISIGGSRARFWNDALKNDDIQRLRGKNGSMIRVMYAPKGQVNPIDGNAYKSWGLWINGNEIESPQAALRSDRHAVFVIQLLGLSLGLFGIVRVLYVRNGLKARESVLAYADGALPKEQGDDKSTTIIKNIFLWLVIALVLLVIYAEQGLIHA